MKTKGKQLLSILLSVSLAVTPSFGAVTTYADETDVIEVPGDIALSGSDAADEDIVAEAGSFDSERSVDNNTEEYGMGYIPIDDGYVPGTVSRTAVISDESLTAEGAVYPLGVSPNAPAYSAIDDGIVPDAFYNQGSYETCWAFSTLSACIINAKKNNIPVDELSVNHLAYYFYNLDSSVEDPQGNEAGDYTTINSAHSAVNWTQAGGNGRLAMWQLASGIGPAEANSDELVYNNFSNTLELPQETEPIYENNDLRIKNVYMANLDSSHGLDAKTLIASYGAVTTGYYANDEFDSFASPNKIDYNDGKPISYGNYCCDNLTFDDDNDGNAEYHAPNHQITLVGWDDMYPKECFIKQPSADGAWLAMNSWGDETTTKAQTGYFWISYQDVGLQTERTCIGYEVEEVDTNIGVYQYDGASGVSYKTVDKATQFFRLDKGGKVVGAGIGVADANVSYTANVYKVVSADEEFDLDEAVENADSWFEQTKGGSNPVGYESVELESLGTTTGTLSYAGFHNIDLSSITDTCAREDIIAVEFLFDTDVRVFVDKTYTLSGFWDFHTGTDEFHSIFGASGGDYEQYAGDNTFRIKMYVEKVSSDTPAITVEESNLSVEKSDETASIEYEITGVEDESEYEVLFGAQNSTYFTVDNEGNITPIKEGGPVSVTVMLMKDGTMVASAECNVTIINSVTAVTLNKHTLPLALHGEETLTYSLTPSDATGTATWESSAPSVATVTSGGKVTGVSYGTATITCTVGGKSDTCEVTVSPSFTGIELDTDAVRIKKGNSTVLMATILPEDTPDEPTITWSSNKTSVATVDGSGKVTGVGYGTATITATAGTHSATCEVEVYGAMTGVSLDRHSAAILKNGSITLEAQALPEDTTDPISFTWSSSKPSVATVNNSGKVTGVSNGITTITVTCNGFSDTCEITVTGELTGIAITPETLFMVPGDTQRISVSLEPANLVDNANINLASSNGNIVTVATNGTVTAKGVGTATITATCTAGGKTFSKVCSVTVSDIAIMEGGSRKTSLSLEKGKSASLSAVYTANGDPASVKWKSSNTAVATIGSDGKVTAVKAGTSTITATTTSNSRSVNLALTVTDAGSSGGGGGEDPTPPTKPTVTVSNESELHSMIVGQTKGISVATSPNTLTNVTKTYSSSAPSVVSVTSDGKMTAKNEGSATVTVTVNCDQGTAKKAFTVNVTRGGSNGGGSADPTDLVDGTYSLVVDNMTDIKNVVIGEDQKIELSVTAKDTNGNAVTVSANDVGGSLEFDYDADGEYITVDADGTVHGLKGGSGRLTVIARVGDNVVLRKTFYVNVKAGNGSYTTDKPGNGGENGGDDSGVSNNTTTPKEGQESDKEKERKAKITEAGPKATDPNTYSKKIVMSSPNGSHEISPDGGQIQLRAVVSPSGTTNPVVKWTSSNPKFASVDQNGLVTGKKAGAGKSVVITTEATDGSGVKGSYFIKIKPHYIKSLKLATEKKVTKKVKKNGKKVKKTVTKNVYKKRKVTGGSSIQIKTVMELTGKDAMTKFKWTSSNTDWATVDKNGKVKTYREGIGHTVTITAELTDHSKKATYKIQIIKPYVKKITLSEKKKSDKEKAKKKAKKIKTIGGVAGKKLALKAKVQTVGKPVDKSLTWKSSNKKWATVDKKGKVTLKKAGAGHTVKITAYSADGKKKGEIKVKIYKTQEEKDKAEKK